MNVPTMPVKTANGSHPLHQADSATGAAEIASLASPLSLAPRSDHRKTSAEFWQNYPLALQMPNGDEVDYADLRGNFSKGLAHDSSGLVDLAAYAALTTALTTGDPVDFAAIPTATPAPLARPFVSPQAGLALELIGPDPQHLAIKAPPKFNSEAIVAEIAENYWMALARDVHFADYQNNPLILDAIHDFEKVLNNGSSLRQSLYYADPAASGQALDPSTIFRGSFVGERMGPFLSQFLLQDCFIGAQQIDQRLRTVMPNVDYMTGFGKWLDVQRGVKQPNDHFDPQIRYMRNGRDLGQWVHVDQLYQAYLLACLQLLDGKAELNPTNPYNGSSNQAGFATFGGPHILSLVTEIATRALKAVWYQKWVVNRRLRPEVFAGRIHVKYLGNANGQTLNFDIDNAIEQINVTNRIYSQYGSLLLPMAFPEGSPLHPAYGAGHATVAGACTTMLKAWFNGSQKLQTLHHPITGAPMMPVQASTDGLSHQSYTGIDAADLTIEGELNKLAANIAIGRNFAGVHWHSDYRESILLGEKVAIGTLMDYAGSFNEPNVHFQFNSFTGHSVEVSDHQVLIDGAAVVQQLDAYSVELAALDQ